MIKKKNARYYLPHYWPLWLIVFILWCIVQLPYRLQMRLGDGLGALMMLFAKNAQRIARINLRLCFPEKNEQEREILLRKSFGSLGKAVFEMGLGFWGTQRRLAKLAHFHGLEKAQKAEQERGLFLIGAHFTTIEIVGRLFAMQYPLAVMYRPHKMGFINFLLERNLTKHYDKAIPRQSMRTMFKMLKAKQTVWYSADVNTKRQHSVFAPFFGIQALTCNAPAKLADRIQSAVFFAYPLRRDDGSGYDIYFDPIDNYPSGSLEADAARVNALIEKAVRRKPEQYLWQYMRFKTRPEGEKRVYSKSIKK
jgi:Kdo2-lipid IVA lauroyltransferase/acyltransferase